MIKIGLMGFEFDSPNKGCEALTYSFLNILRMIYTSKEDILIYNFSGTGLGRISEEFSEFKFIEVKPKLKDLTFYYIRMLKSCNIIFDVTMGDSFSDIYSEKRFNALSRHKRIAESVCKNYILLPQTYGPFNSNTTMKKAKNILKKAAKIYCRDQLSKDLLENSFNIYESELVSDMAFILPYNKELYTFDCNEKIKIGINVSGLLYKGGFDSNNQFELTLNYKEYIEKLIRKLIAKEKYEIHLIPHVIDVSENSHDDDYKVCSFIQSLFKECKLAPMFKTPIEAKSYISNMDIFIGSRMHSTIASFSTDVITIPVSYSRKFEGLFNSLNYKYLIDGKNNTAEDALQKTLEYIENWNELKKCQTQSFQIISNKNNRFIESLGEFIKKFGE